MKTSVVIPVYNVEHYLRQCLDSVFAQQLDDYEVICVNDGSQDGSAEILEEYAAQNQNLTIIKQENKGLSGARNTGLRAAKGDYVFFLDSDDFIIDSIVLPEIVEYAVQNNLDVCVFNAMINGQDEYFNAFGKLEGEVLSGSEYFRKSFQVAMDLPTPIWLHLYKRDFLQAHNLQFKEGLLHEDELFTPWTVYEAQCIACINKPVVHYRFNRKDSITNKASRKNFEHRLNTARELFRHYEDIHAIEETFRLVFSMYMNLCVEMDADTRKEIFESSDTAIMKSCAKTPYEKKCYKLFAFSPDLLVKYKKNTLHPIIRKIINFFL